jgi:hypothetical protein
MKNPSAAQAASPRFVAMEGQALPVAGLEPVIRRHLAL